MAERDQFETQTEEAIGIGPRLLVLAAALLFSTGGFAIKSCGLGAWQIASFRCGVAALALWLLLPAARRRWTLPEVLVGCTYAATLVSYAVATKSTTAANAIFLQSTSPLYLLILAPLVLGEKIRRWDLGLAAATAGGLALVLSAQSAVSATAPNPALGNAFGTLAGICWALTVLGLRWLATVGEAAEQAAQREGGRRARNRILVALVAGNVIGCVATLPLALPVGPSTPRDWLWLVFLGVVQIALAYLCLTAGLRRLPAFEASLLLLAEPVFNPVWTWWLHGEVPAPVAIAGGALILAAAALKTWVDARARRARCRAARSEPSSR